MSDVVFETGQPVVWRKASARGHQHDWLVPAVVLRDDGQRRVLIEAHPPQSLPVRRWVVRERVQTPSSDEQRAPLPSTDPYRAK